MTAYQELSRSAVSRFRLPYEASQDDRTVVVIGEPSSGTRLVRDIILASGLPVVHDGQHGHRPWTSGRTVIVTRDPDARQESVDARWPDGIRGAPYPTLEDLRAAYPDALEVAYEDIVADKDAVIVELADALEVDPWVFTEEIYDANAEPGTRETGPRRRAPSPDERP